MDAEATAVWLACYESADQGMFGRATYSLENKTANLHLHWWTMAQKRPDMQHVSNDCY